MAESKGALIAKSVQKHAGRAKEKILQNLGKVDRTADEIFDEHLQNFNRQQQQATRLQKEFNNYIRCIRAVQTASKSLMEAITDVYESSWSGHDLLTTQSLNMEMLWQDFSHKLGDQVLIPLNTYQGQFPEMKKKIDKRGRKLVDYDCQRHTFQSLQANAAKRKDDVKVTRGREQLEEAKRTYEILNSELHDELPALHDSRILFLVSNLQTLFTAEQLFHNETAKVYAELEAITDKLATDSQRGSYNIKKSQISHSPIVSPNKTATLNSHNGNITPTNTIQPAWSETNTSAESPPPSPRKDEDDDSSSKEDTPSSPSPSAVGVTIATDAIEATVAAMATTAVPPAVAAQPDDNRSPLPTAVNGNVDARRNDNNNPHDRNGKRVEDLYDIPVGATLSDLPAGVLYRVKATYRYVREDQDELSFDVGDIIRVVEYDDPEEQEEGWLMGIKENSSEKGMFPANFTRPI